MQIYLKMCRTGIRPYRYQAIDLSAFMMIEYSAVRGISRIDFMLQGTISFDSIQHT